MGTFDRIDLEVNLIINNLFFLLSDNTDYTDYHYTDYVSALRNFEKTNL